MMLLLSAVVLAGCDLGGIGAPAATYTPYPTYTPFPTNTPEPTATATFLPTATTIPTSTPTSELTEEPTSGATATPAGQASGILLYGANLREGPGTDYRAIVLLNSGDALTIRGRDFDGRWLCVTTATGTQGWVAVQQFQGPLDVARIPLCTEVPTPNATQLARGTNTPRPVTGTPGTATTGTPGTSSTAAATTNPSAGNYFEVLAGGPEVCNTVTVVMNGQFHVDSKTADILPFDDVTPHDEVRRQAFKYELPGFPTYFKVKPSGNAKPGQCSASENICQSLTLKLCGQATADAPTGGWEYTGFSINIIVGTQSYDVFYEEARGSFGVVFKIPEKK